MSRNIQEKKRRRPIRMKKRRPAPLTIVPKTAKEIKRDTVIDYKKKKQKLVQRRKAQKFRNYLKKQQGKKTLKKKRKTVRPEQLVDVEQIATAIKGVRLLSNKLQEETTELMNIGSDSLICLQVTLCRLPKESMGEVPKILSIKIPLPHAVVNEETDVLLITRMLNTEHGSDYEKTLNHFKELLRSKGAARHITEVVTLRQLRMEYKEYEAKKNLANRFDIVLAQDSIMMTLPKLLGKHFYGNKKAPIKVDLTVSNLEQHIQEILSTSILELTMKGTSSLAQVGRESHSDEELTENILMAVKKIAARLPGGFNNIESLSLKTPRSKTVPFYIKLAKDNVIIKAPKQAPEEIVEERIDTAPQNVAIRVASNGLVKIVPKDPADLAKKKDTLEETSME